MGKKVHYWPSPLRSNSGFQSMQAVWDGRALWDMNDFHCDLDKHCGVLVFKSSPAPLLSCESRVFCRKKVRFVKLFVCLFVLLHYIHLWCIDK